MKNSKLTAAKYSGLLIFFLFSFLYIFCSFTAAQFSSNLTQYEEMEPSWSFSFSKETVRAPEHPIFLEVADQGIKRLNDTAFRIIVYPYVYMGKHMGYFYSESGDSYGIKKMTKSQAIEDWHVLKFSIYFCGLDIGDIGKYQVSAHTFGPETPTDRKWKGKFAELTYSLEAKSDEKTYVFSEPSKWIEDPDNKRRPAKYSLVMWQSPKESNSDSVPEQAKSVPQTDHETAAGSDKNVSHDVKQSITIESKNTRLLAVESEKSFIDGVKLEKEDIIISFLDRLEERQAIKNVIQYKPRFRGKKACIAFQAQNRDNSEKSTVMKVVTLEATSGTLNFETLKEVPDEDACRSESRTIEVSAGEQTTDPADVPDNAAQFSSTTGENGEPSRVNNEGGPAQQKKESQPVLEMVKIYPIDKHNKNALKPEENDKIIVKVENVFVDINPTIRDTYVEVKRADGRQFKANETIWIKYAKKGYDFGVIEMPPAATKGGRYDISLEEIHRTLNLKFVNLNGREIQPQEVRYYYEKTGGQNYHIVTADSLTLERNTASFRIHYPGSSNFKEYDTGWKGYTGPETIVIKLLPTQKHIVFEVRDSYTKNPVEKATVRVTQGKEEYLAATHTGGGNYRIDLDIYDNQPYTFMIAADKFEALREEKIFSLLAVNPVQIYLKPNIVALKIKADVHFRDEGQTVALKRGEVRVNYIGQNNQKTSKRLQFNSEKGIYTEEIRYLATTIPEVSVRNSPFFVAKEPANIPESGDVLVRMDFKKPVLYVLINPSLRLRLGPVRNDIDNLRWFKEKFFDFNASLFKESEWKSKWSRAYLFAWHAGRTPHKLLSQNEVGPRWNDPRTRDQVMESIILQNSVIDYQTAISEASAFLDGFSFPDDRDNIRGVFFYILGAPNELPDKKLISDLDGLLKKNRMIGFIVQFADLLPPERKDYTREFGTFNHLRFIEMDMTRELDDRYFGPAFRYVKQVMQNFLNERL